ncbi:hypothetical protein BS47DRAFT_1363850 [Hydnum rufescens UP504]|uniref:Uncharacterized protein n=1 Tax=Hydnum rufescens UP504 TaxID=1448309 RepID=A0A9P6DV48_9AGAM|nr:hypothetical protein BS47DRAFT_1363850 [Hydnum rufescens UP504]
MNPSTQGKVVRGSPCVEGGADHKDCRGGWWQHSHNLIPTTVNMLINTIDSAGVVGGPDTGGREFDGPTVDVAATRPDRIEHMRVTRLWVNWLLGLAMLCQHRTSLFCISSTWQTCEDLLPFSISHICALPNTTSALILATCVAHNDAAPVLDLRWEDGVIAASEGDGLKAKRSMRENIFIEGLKGLKEDQIETKWKMNVSAWDLARLGVSGSGMHRSSGGFYSRSRPHLASFQASHCGIVAMTLGTQQEGAQHRQAAISELVWSENTEQDERPMQAGHDQRVGLESLEAKIAGTKNNSTGGGSWGKVTYHAELVFGACGWVS